MPNMDKISKTTVIELYDKETGKEIEDSKVTVDIEKTKVHVYTLDSNGKKHNIKNYE